jgi:hypothetical protein
LAPQAAAAYGNGPGGTDVAFPAGRFLDLRSWHHARRLAPLAALAAVLGCEVRDEPAAPAASGWRVLPVVESAPLLHAAAATPTAIEYVEGFDSGLRRAAEDGRPLLAVFRGAWCRWSAELAQGALADSRVVGLSRQFVCVAVDADRDAATCRRFGVDRFPTVLVCDASGAEQFRTTGSAAEGLADAMTAVLEAGGGRRRIAVGRPSAAR